MKGNAVEMCLLFDFYGDMLTEKQKEIFNLYYNEDLSLSEISEIAGITRQGVRDAIVRSETALQNFEEKTGLVLKFNKLSSTMYEIHELIDSFAKSSDFRRMTNENADKIRKIWFLSEAKSQPED